MSKVMPGHFEIIAKVRSTTKDFLPFFINTEELVADVCLRI